jgi:hypothetical protein
MITHKDLNPLKMMAVPLIVNETTDVQLVSLFVRLYDLLKKLRKSDQQNRFSASKEKV